MTKKKRGINKFIYLLIITLIGFSTLGMSSKDEESKKIHDNILIEKVHVGKLTRKEATDKIKKHYPINNININYNDIKWTIKAEDINLDYNIEKSVKEAFDYTRDKSVWNNIKRKGKLNLNKPYNIKLKEKYVMK